MILGSSKDYGTGVVLIIWDGIRPSDDEFHAHAAEEYGTTGALEVYDPVHHRAGNNPGAATITPPKDPRHD